METLLIRRREPFEVAFLAFLLLSGVTQLVSGSRPGTIEVLLPNWIHLMWAILLTVGCAAALAGMLWRDVVTGIFLERLGLAIAGWSIFIYGASITVVAGAKGITAAAVCFAIVVAAVARLRDLNRVIRKLPRK